MKRQKTVFRNTREVCHIWAQQKQSEGRAGNVFFEGSTIYSYGHHFAIAKFLDPETVLFTTRNYSVSTSKHKRCVLNAIPGGVKMIYAQEVDTSLHDDNVKTMFWTINNYRSKGAKSLRVSHYVGLMIDETHNLKNYVEYFKVKLKGEEKKQYQKYVANSFYTPQEFVKCRERENKKIERDAQKTRLENELRELKRAEFKKNAEENLVKWLAGETVEGIGCLDKISLRVNGEEIQTTKGAYVPLFKARRLWDKLSKGEDVKGLDMGHYTVDSFDGKILKAGCHEIEIEEIKRIAGVLGWLTA